MDFDPNIDEMIAHFALLYNWTQTAYPRSCLPSFRIDDI